MTDALIISTYEDMLDGQSTLPQSLEIVLANNAKNKLETELKLEILKRVDTSITTTPGGTYTTPYTLPGDFFEGMGYIYVDIFPYIQIPFEQRESNKFNPRVFYIDQSQNPQQLFICGSMGAARTVTVPYWKESADITAATVAAQATTVSWPDRFHLLLSMEMAKMEYAVDAGDKERSWDDRWQAAYNELKNQLINWDAALKLASIGNSTPYGHPLSPFGANALGIPLALM
jgi:hypothetical protein